MVRWLFSIAGMALAMAAFAWAGRIDRLDVYDNADNHLLFVTFEYDGAGNNTGRTVYASDSTFLRTVSLTKAAGGAVTAEKSADYENNLLYTTSLAARPGGRTGMTVSDQFKMDMLGAPFTFNETSGNHYDISQSGGPQYKQRYELAADGSLRRVDFMDQSGAILYYATVPQSGIVSPAAGAASPARPMLRTAADGRLLVTLDLASPSRVRIELFTAAGRRAAAVTKETRAAGRQVIAATAHGVFVGNGTYILRISVNDASFFHERLVLLAR